MQNARGEFPNPFPPHPSIWPSRELRYLNFYAFRRDLYLKHKDIRMENDTEIAFPPASAKLIKRRNFHSARAISSILPLYKYSVKCYTKLNTGIILKFLLSLKNLQFKIKLMHDRENGHFRLCFCSLLSKLR